MRFRVILFLIICIGLGLRLFLASLNLHNFDILMYEKDIEILREGKNVYAEQKHYNYTPFWFLTLGAIDNIPFLRSLPFYFTIRAFLTLIDVVSLFILVRIAAQRGLNLIKTSAFFFLNPISIIITGYHGQFDNIVILFLLIAIYLHGKSFEGLSRTKIVLIWLATSMSLIVKHIILFPITFFWFNITKRWKAILAMISSVIIFLTTFLPYATDNARHNILKNVFLYRSVEGRYGIGEVLNIRCPDRCVFTTLKLGSYSVSLDVFLIYFLLFLGGFLLCLFLIRFKDPARGALFGILYFLTFTNGIGAQYLMLPIALGALFPTKWFLLFSMTITFFMIGDSDELGIVAFSGFRWIVPWLFSLLWFISEFLQVSSLARRVYRRVVLQ
jgi:hypothetical protein